MAPAIRLTCAARMEPWHAVKARLPSPEALTGLSAPGGCCNCTYAIHHSNGKQHLTTKDKNTTVIRGPDLFL
jgi:hypothetical protein